MFWSIIDNDACLSDAAKISVPKVIKMGHLHRKKVEKTKVPTKLEPKKLEPTKRRLKYRKVKLLAVITI